MPGELTTYKDKRNFRRTPEPAGRRRRPAAPEPRFVVQEHHARRLHWDLRLERDGVLKSWAVPNGIPAEPKQNRKAVPTEDHPLEYLEFEGEIPAGNYGAGTMSVWDHGTYTCSEWTEHKIRLRFDGSRLRGEYAMFRTRDGDWMIHRIDPPEAELEPMPETLAPMLACRGELPQATEGWGYEIKWDGIRAIAHYEPGRLRLFGRRGGEITHQYPEIRPLARQLGARSAILDGEIMAFGADGKPSFERLQQRMSLTSESQIRRRAADTPVTLALFDLIFLDGRRTSGLPYTDRRALLEELELNGTAWSTPQSHADGPGLLQATGQAGLEGIIAKRLSSRYEPGRRSRDWIKIKHSQRQELLVGGWLAGQGSRSGRIGALLVGEPGPQGLRYRGRVGSGLSEPELERLQGLLAPIARASSPFAGGRLPRGAKWVEPRERVRVDYTEQTKQGLLRHPVYRGRAEAELAPRSNASKVLFPRGGFTKGELIEFYRGVAEALLPHLRGRALTMKRYPDGVEGKFFYEKHCPTHRPDWIRTVAVQSEQNKAAISFCVIDDERALLWVANLASIELHTSLHLAEEPDHPRSLVFDLDPGPPAGVLECAQVALELRELFEQLRLQTLIKTSGSKGLQLYVPLNSGASYEQTKPLARAVAELLEKRHPELIVSRMTKAIRKGKVLIDWSQNDRHKTTVSVYSVRAREQPTVSTPLSWSELEAALDQGDPDALSFTAQQVLERVAGDGDLFAPMAVLQQPLPVL